MRYKVFYGPGKDTYAVCYGADKTEAANHFGEYNPHTVILDIQEFPDATEPKKDLYDLVSETDAEEAIRYLIEAIEDAGVEHRVAGYLYRHGFGRDNDEDDE